MNWVLVLTIFWYHAPAVTQVQGFADLQACEKAAVAVNKKFTESFLYTSSLAKSVCVSLGDLK